MSDGSSSSRESSPGRFRPRSPNSDTESAAPSSWQTSSTALHPSAFQSAVSSTASLLRQPVGFGAGSTSVSSHHPSHPAAPSHYAPPHHRSAEDQSTISRKKAPKGKEKDRPKDRSRRSKERDKGKSSRQSVAQPSKPHYPTGHPPSDVPVQRTAFRVRSYTNDPTAVGSPPTIQEGPYGAAYRATVDGRADDERSQSTQPQSRHQHARSAQSTADTQPRSSYYRYDYEKVRESAPANRAKKAAAAPPIHHHSSPPPPPPQSYPYHNSTSAPSSDSHNRSSRSSKRKDTPMYPTDHLYSPAPQYYGDTHDPSTVYFDPASANYQEQPPATHSPSPAPSREKRHKSRSRRHEQPHYSSPVHPQEFVPPPPPQPDLPQPSVRVCRVLTLLIEDKRYGEGENMLTEVRVQLKQVDGGDVGFWADAQEVTEELQKGPSRIDGRAKVYTLRGKYKQYFLRISHDGEEVCQPANLKVSPDRTLEIFIEDNPPPIGTSFATSSPSRGVEREMLTPVTDTMASPSPAPVQMPSHKRASRSSLFSADDLISPSPSEKKFDKTVYEELPRKRQRSTSVQSVESENYLQPPHHSAFSPFTHRSPFAFAMPSSAAQSRTPSQTSQPSRPQPQESGQLSPVSPSSDLPTPQPARTHPSPAQLAESHSFSQTQQSPSPVRAASGSFTPNPSPPKRPKLVVPQSQARAEHSVSPGPSQAGAFPWSDARTPSTSIRPAPSAFAQYADSGATKAPVASLSTSTAFPSYESGVFSLPTPQSEASNTPAPQGNIALPFVPITVPSVPSFTPAAPAPPAPLTMPPSAMSVAPTLSGGTAAPTELDNAVGKHIREIISKEPEWDTFVRNRARVLTVREQLTQYAYLQGILERFVGMSTPVDLAGAGGVAISTLQVMRAFNLGLAFAEECAETLLLTEMYGPGGSRGEDARVVEMLDQPPPIATNIQAKRYLKLLQDVHRQWTASHSG